MGQQQVKKTKKTTNSNSKNKITIVLLGTHDVGIFHFYLKLIHK